MKKKKAVEKKDITLPPVREIILQILALSGDDERHIAPLLQMVASEALGALGKASAKGDSGAAWWLVNCLRTHTTKLLKLCDKRPEMFESVAREHRCFPSLQFARADFQKEHVERVVKKLPIGDNTVLHQPRKKLNEWRPGTSAVARALAERLEDRRHGISTDLMGRKLDPKDDKKINRLASELPALTRKTFPVWWKVALPFFLAAFGKDFDTAPEFTGSRLSKDDIRRAIRQDMRGIPPK